MYKSMKKPTIREIARYAYDKGEEAFEGGMSAVESRDLAYRTALRLSDKCSRDWAKVISRLLLLLGIVEPLWYSVPRSGVLRQCCCQLCRPRGKNEYA